MVGGALLSFSGVLPDRDKREVTSSTVTDFAAMGGPFELTTHRDGALTNEDLKGKPYLVFFGFTHCPDICPTTLFELTSLMQDLGPDAEKITPLFITIDPERDTQEFLASYINYSASRSEERRVGKGCVCK